MDETLRALNHFGLGARPGERARIGEPRAWLRAQLEGAPPEIDAASLVSSKEIATAIANSRGPALSDMERRMARARLVQIAGGESRAALAHRAASDRPFVERLVAFWSNHFCVSGAGKQLIAPLAGSYERQAIRPHVLGRFEEMVVASARHPAMLIYLDNFQSIGPESPAVEIGAAVQRGGAAARRGLNENYARELLELHTLGVNGGYTQDDVLQVARIFTGWTVTGIGGPADAAMRAAAARPRLRAQLRAGAATTSDDGLGFVFREILHEPGPKTAVGKVYRESGVREGEDLIRDLCRHPSTARFIATKLATHFVSDDPPPAAIDRLAGVFTETNGDLRALSRAVIDLDEAWTAPTRKFRSPQDWLVAVLRAFNGVQSNDAFVLALRQLRHPLWAPPSPKGFPDTAREWTDPDSLLNRAELARTLTGRLAARRSLDPRSLLEVVETASGDPLPAMLADNTIPAPERLALAIAGPAFQWR